MSDFHSPFGKISADSPGGALRATSLDRSRLPKATRLSVVVVSGGIALALALTARALHTQNVNWDEFLRLSEVHAVSRGQSLPFLQYAYVHAFRWLPYLGGHEIDQIVAARHAMYVLHIGTLILLYAIGRHFASPWAALAAVLAFTGTSYVTEHAVAFRHDPMATLVLMAALLVILRLPTRPYAPYLTGGLLAVAMSITVKAIFFLPVFLAVFLTGTHRRSGWKAAISWGAPATAAFISTAAATYLLHHLLTPAPNTDSHIRRFLGDTNRYIPLDELIPRTEYLLHFLATNPLVVALASVGFYSLIATAIHSRGKTRLKAFTGLSLGLPLLSLLFYRNAFPYYYLPLLAFAAPWLAMAADAIHRLSMLRSLQIGHVFQVALSLCLAALPPLALIPLLSDHQDHQRALIRTVHTLFPTPVPYLDRCGMIASFPRRGFFMSTLGMSKYHSDSHIALAETLDRRPAVFLIANHPAFRHALTGHPADLHPLLQFKPLDATHLRQNYLHHWGLLFVAGKQLDLSAEQTRPFSIAVPGEYTLETAHPIVIDGHLRQPGEAFHLPKGMHSAHSHATVSVTLRWGEQLPRPSRPPPRTPVFHGF